MLFQTPFSAFFSAPLFLLALIRAPMAQVVPLVATNYISQAGSCRYRLPTRWVIAPPTSQLACCYMGAIPLQSSPY